MMKRCDKKGQFYLLSAIVIISIIIGFSAISNYTKKSGEIRIFDIGEELNIESGNVLDYGTYPSNNVADLNDFLLAFVDDYAAYVGEDKKISFVYGDEMGANKVSYEEIVLGKISAGTLATETSQRKSIRETSPITTEGTKSKTTIKFNNQDYEIELKPGENFYFVISQQVGEEVHTTSSKGVEGTNIKTDSVAPTISITYPIEDENYHSHVNKIEYIVSDDIELARCKYSLNGGELVLTLPDCSGSIIGLNSELGENTWIVYAEDTSNNVALDSVTFRDLTSSQSPASSSTPTPTPSAPPAPTPPKQTKSICPPWLRWLCDPLGI